jgi:hypothetical protein
MASGPWIASTVFSRARKLQGTVHKRCFEGTFDGFCGDVESATLRDDVSEVRRLFAIGVSIQDSLNECVQGVDRKAVESKEFADSVIGNAGSHAELVQNGPYMRIRNAQAHRDNLEVHVDGVEHQRLNACFGEYEWQVLRGCLEEGSARAPYRPACCFRPVDPGDGSESAGACSCGELLFAVGDEIQTGGTDCGANIRDTNEDNLVSSGLQFAGQRGHRIEVTGERHTNKANFHTVFRVLNTRAKIPAVPLSQLP